MSATPITMSFAKASEYDSNNSATGASHVSALAKLADAIAALACAQAEANKLQARLWENLKPSTRAKLLGVSTRTEHRRRQQARLNPKPL